MITFMLLCMLKHGLLYELSLTLPCFQAIALVHKSGYVYEIYYVCVIFVFLNDEPLCYLIG